MHRTRQTHWLRVLCKGCIHKGTQPPSRFQSSNSKAGTTFSLVTRRLESPTVAVGSIPPLHALPLRVSEQISESWFIRSFHIFFDWFIHSAPLTKTRIIQEMRTHSFLPLSFYVVQGNNAMPTWPSPSNWKWNPLQCFIFLIYFLNKKSTKILYYCIILCLYFF